MRKKIFLFFLAFASLSYCKAQNPRVNPSPNSIYSYCDLDSVNNIWRAKFNSELDVAKRFELVKMKLVSDTLYKNLPSKPYTIRKRDVVEQHLDAKGNLCGLKILFVLGYQKKKTVYLDLLDHPNYSKIFDLIDYKNATITSIVPAAGVALYGYRGSSGVVYIKINDKDSGRAVAKIIDN